MQFLEAGLVGRPVIGVEVVCNEGKYGLHKLVSFRVEFLQGAGQKKYGRY